MHEGIKEFKCEECSYKASEKFSLQCHFEKAHKCNKRFQCEKCSFSGATTTSLKMLNKARHDKIKDNICVTMLFRNSKILQPICPYEEKKNFLQRVQLCYQYKAAFGETCEI